MVRSDYANSRSVSTPYSVLLLLIIIYYRYPLASPSPFTSTSSTSNTKIHSPTGKVTVIDLVTKKIFQKQAYRCM